MTAPVIVPPDLVAMFANRWQVSEAEVERTLQIMASIPIAEPVEGVTPGGIHWRSTAYHGKDRRR
jgi:hypothetical protein